MRIVHFTIFISTAVAVVVPYTTEPSDDHDQLQSLAEKPSTILYGLKTVISASPRGIYSGHIKQTTKDPGNIVGRKKRDGLGELKDQEGGGSRSYEDPSLTTPNGRGEHASHKEDRVHKDIKACGRNSKNIGHGDQSVQTADEGCSIDSRGDNDGCQNKRRERGRSSNLANGKDYEEDNRDNGSNVYVADETVCVKDHDVDKEHGASTEENQEHASHADEEDTVGDHNGKKGEDSDENSDNSRGDDEEDDDDEDEEDSDNHEDDNISYTKDYGTDYVGYGGLGWYGVDEGYAWLFGYGAYGDYGGYSGHLSDYGEHHGAYGHY